MKYQTVKATLEFNLPEDNVEFKDATNGTSWKLTLWEMDQYLRSQLKYNDKLTQEQHDILQEARDKLHELKNEAGLSFD